MPCFSPLWPVESLCCLFAFAEHDFHHGTVYARCGSLKVTWKTPHTTHHTQHTTQNTHIQHTHTHAHAHAQHNTYTTQHTMHTNTTTTDRDLERVSTTRRLQTSGSMAGSVTDVQTWVATLDIHPHSWRIGYKRDVQLKSMGDRQRKGKCTLNFDEYEFKFIGHKANECKGREELEAHGYVDLPLPKALESPRWYSGSGDNCARVCFSGLGECYVDLEETKCSQRDR